MTNETNKLANVLTQIPNAEFAKILVESAIDQLAAKHNVSKAAVLENVWAGGPCLTQMLELVKAGIEFANDTLAAHLAA